MTAPAGTSSGEGGVGELAEGIRRLGAALRRRRREILLVFVTVFVAVQALAFFWPATYAARAAILVEQRRGGLRLEANPALAPRVVSAGVTDEQVNSEIAIMKSRAVLEATVRATGLDRVPPPWYLRLLFWPLRAYERIHAAWHEVAPPSDLERAVRGLGDSLQVDHLKDSNVLVATYEGGDPQVAEVVLGRLVAEYLDHHQRLARSEEVEGFFTEQTRILESELEGLEDSLRALEADAGVVDVARERDVELEILARLRQEEADLERRLSELDARVATYRTLLTDGDVRALAADTAGQSELGLQALKKDLLDLSLEQVRLERHYKEGSSLIAENRAKLEAAHRVLEEQRRQAMGGAGALLNPSGLSISTELAEVRAERAGLEQRREVLAAQLAETRERAVALDGRLLEADRMRRRIRTTEEKYVTHLKRQVDARIDAALDAQKLLDVTVVQEARGEAKPVRPKKLVVLLASTIGGLLAALLVCIVLEARALGLERMLGALLPREESAT